MVLDLPLTIILNFFECLNCFSYFSFTYSSTRYRTIFINFFCLAKSNICIWYKFIFFKFFNFFLYINIRLFNFLHTKFFYIKSRITNFFDLSSKGNYQSQKATDAIVDGGFFGKGIGEGTLNTKVPEAHTDYVISVISEEIWYFVLYY